MGGSVRFCLCNNFHSMGLTFLPAVDGCDALNVSSHSNSHVTRDTPNVCICCGLGLFTMLVMCLCRVQNCAIFMEILQMVFIAVLMFPVLGARSNSTI